MALIKLTHQSMSTKHPEGNLYFSVVALSVCSFVSCKQRLVSLKIHWKKYKWSQIRKLWVYNKSNKKNVDTKDQIMWRVEIIIIIKKNIHLSINPSI